MQIAHCNGSGCHDDARSPAVTLWVVYDSPSDLPGRFVARKWLNETPTAELLQAKSLRELRERLPSGMHRIPRATADDPRIVETWI